jgi:putative membrane protein
VKHQFAYVLGPALAAALVLTAAAQQNPTPRDEDQRGTPNLPGTTRSEPLTPQTFIQQAFQANQNEMRMAQLAGMKASSSDVKEYARQLESDHSKAMKTLQEMATKDNKVPTELANADESPRMRDLTSKSGADFDKAFIEMMVDDHQKAISLYERANIENFSDSDLKKFASDQLPELRTHLERARELQKQMGGKGEL